jgi:hypothetical protein
MGAGRVASRFAVDTRATERAVDASIVAFDSADGVAIPSALATAGVTFDDALCVPALLRQKKYGLLRSHVLLAQRCRRLHGPAHRFWGYPATARCNTAGYDNRRNEGRPKLANHEFTFTIRGERHLVAHGMCAQHGQSSRRSGRTARAPLQGRCPCERVSISRPTTYAFGAKYDKWRGHRVRLRRCPSSDAQAVSGLHSLAPPAGRRARSPPR